MSNPFNTGNFNCCNCPQLPEDEEPPKKYLHRCGCPTAEVVCESVSKTATLCGVTKPSDNTVPANAYLRRITLSGWRFFGEFAFVNKTTWSVEGQTCSSSVENMCLFAEGDYVNRLFVYRRRTWPVTEVLSNTNLAFSLPKPVQSYTVTTEPKDYQSLSVCNGDQCCLSNDKVEGELTWNNEWEGPCFEIDEDLSTKSFSTGSGTLTHMGNGNFTTGEGTEGDTLYGDQNCGQEIASDSDPTEISVTTERIRSLAIATNENPEGENDTGFPGEGIVLPFVDTASTETEEDALGRANSVEGASCSSLYQLRTSTLTFTRREVTYTVRARDLQPGVTYTGCLRLKRREAYSGTPPEGANTEWEEIEPQTLTTFTADPDEDGWTEIETGELPNEQGWEYQIIGAQIWPTRANCDCPTEHEG